MARKKESKLQTEIQKFLEARGWLTQNMHGSQFQAGVPDIYSFHPEYQTRWVEVKVKGRYTFTNAQKHTFPAWTKFGVGIWILADATTAEYDKLFQPPNWLEYWKDSWGDPFNQPTPVDILKGYNDDTSD